MSASHPGGASNSAGGSGAPATIPTRTVDEPETYREGGGSEEAIFAPIAPPQFSGAIRSRSARTRRRIDRPFCRIVGTSLRIDARSSPIDALARRIDGSRSRNDAQRLRIVAQVLP